MSAQPPVDQAYNTSGNAASKEPAEQAQASKPDNTGSVEQRIPQKQTMSSDEATPSASGQGVRGAGPGEEGAGLTDQDKGNSEDVDAEQMAAPGEGDVASAVKSNTPGKQQ